MKVQGSVGLVTGGASGLGEGVVRMLAANGGRAAIFDLPSSKGAEIAEELGDAAEFFPVDVTDPDDVERSVAAVAERFGRIDLLMNCAGISSGQLVVGRLTRGQFPPYRLRGLGRFRRGRVFVGECRRRVPGRNAQRTRQRRRWDRHKPQECHPPDIGQDRRHGLIGQQVLARHNMPRFVQRYFPASPGAVVGRGDRPRQVGRRRNGAKSVSTKPP